MTPPRPLLYSASQKKVYTFQKSPHRNEYMNIKRAQVHDRSFRVNKKKNFFIFFISSIKKQKKKKNSSITLYLTIMVRQHCKYKFKCTLVMIINIHVTCGGGGGGSFCLMDLGPFLIIWTWAFL